MTDKEKYIKSVFVCYRENKRRLKEISFNELKGVDYSKQKGGGYCKDGNESAIVKYLDEKRDIEKQIELVERVIWYYKLDGKGKDEYIKQRYEKRKTFVSLSLDLYVSESTLYGWDKDIKALAVRVADMFNLW